MRHPKPTPLMNAGRTVRQAAQMLEEHAWRQHNIGSKNNPLGMCVQGAIKAVLFGDTFINSKDLLRNQSRINEACNVETLFARWLRENQYTNGITVPAWNDTKGRTKEEIIATMHKFADEVDPQKC